MRRVALVTALLLGSSTWVPSVEPRKPEPVKPATTHQVKLNGHTFTLPEGFEVELAAAAPQVLRPIAADFDDDGRLHVSDSSGSNEKVVIQLEKKPHRIVRLEDTKGTGRFDGSVVFADHLSFPEGVAWHAGSLYVGAPPSIWKLTDADGDGKAEKREEWFQGRTLTGCANDLHGPYVGPDGWIYWCKGAWARQDHVVNGKPFTTRASHVFRCRTDGTGIEPVMTGGMDNPVDVAFTPGGERIFTTTFFQHPAGGKRDGLIHAIYGGVYGKDHAVVYDHPWTGPTLLPVLTHLGAAAPCGLHRYESSAFGPDYQDNLFAALFNMHKITRHVLIPDGATFTTRDEDFLVSDNLDFHPTDVIEDADGSLLVVDTGGWYKLCCPTSQLQKPDVLGAIYRVRRAAAKPVDDPRGRTLPWATLPADDLVKLLGDPRPAVRKRAIRTLAGRDKKEATQALKRHSTRGTSAEARRNAVWAETQMNDPECRSLTRERLFDPDASVRQAALHAVSLGRDKASFNALVEVLRKDQDPHARRTAAEALGRIGDDRAVPVLFQQLETPADRVMEHSLIYALIEIGNADLVTAKLRDGNPRVRRAALIVLDQMKRGGLTAEVAAQALTAPDPYLKEAAWWIAGRHPEWGGALAGFLRERLAAKELTLAERVELSSQLARFAGSVPVQDMLAETLRQPASGDLARVLTLQAMAQAGLKETPPAWIAALTLIVSGNDLELKREAVAAARQLRISKAQAEAFTGALVTLANDEKTPAPVRIAALAAVPGGLARVEPAQFTLLRGKLGPDEPVAVRSLAAEVLARAPLQREQLVALAETVRTAGPMEVNRLLEAYGQSTDESVGLALLAALKASAARASLRSDALKTHLAKYPAAVRQEAEGLYAIIDVDAAQQRARLEKLLATIKGGDVRRGQLVFNSTKAACSSCHAIGYLGGKVGPDLTRVAQIRTERDLLEAIVFPSASFVRSYEPVMVTTRDGKTFNGLLRKDAPDEVLLVINATEEVRIPRNQIEDVLPSKVSVMPSGLDQQLTPQELIDLVTFLRACK